MQRRLDGSLCRATAVLLFLVPCLESCGHRSSAPEPTAAAVPNESVDLTSTQSHSVFVQPVTARSFTPVRETVGTIDFNEDMTVQVSPPYQGRVARLLASAGDKVAKGQLLFTIESPDLVQAESTLIAAAGALKLTSNALARAKELTTVQGIAQKDYEQAVADQQSAEGAYKAARDAVRVFGKSEAEIERILAQRRVDAEMPVLSPIAGVVTARSAAPGTLVQPGASPAPYAVADLSTKWMLAAVSEADVPTLRIGQAVDVKVFAYPGQLFQGHITHIAESLDPSTRRAVVRSEIRDPHDLLRAQMFASFVVHVGATTQALAVPVEALVREGDGTMSVWVTRDGHRFTRRTVQIGQQQDGFEEILKGLSSGERIASTGALFISNASIQGAAD